MKYVRQKDVDSVRRELYQRKGLEIIDRADKYTLTIAKTFPHLSGAEVKHLEYLHNQASGPMLGLLAQLKQDIGDSGTVLTWNMSYEKGCNDRMAELFPEYADFLADLNDRIDDLITPFAKMWFFDKDFFGSASVKKIMSVLAPELSYK